MKKLLPLLLLFSALAFGQGAFNTVRDVGTVTTSANTFTHPNIAGEITIQVEYLISGSPTISSIVIKGCMRGGTCSTLNTYSSSTSTVVGVSGLYDYYTVVPTWTGGTSPAVTINWLGSTRASSSSGGGLGNVILSGTPSSGQVPVATSSTTATWQTLSGSGTVTSVATAGLASGGPITGTGTVTVAGSGNTTTAATATSGVAGAATGFVVTTDGSGNVQNSATLLSALETNAAAIAAFSGHGSCTNQVVTVANANAAPTCTTITSAYVDSSIALIAGPTFTGTPSAPTATALTSNTQLATTAYADAAVAVEKSRALTAEALAAPASTTLCGAHYHPIAGASDSISAAGAFATTASVASTCLTAGALITIRAHGVYTTGATTTPKFNMQVDAGGTPNICPPASSGFTLNINQSGGYWDLTCMIQINTTGAPGTAVAWGDAKIDLASGVVASGQFMVFNNAGTGTVAYTTSSTQTVTIKETTALVTGQSFNLTALDVLVTQ